MTTLFNQSIQTTQSFGDLTKGMDWEKVNQKIAQDDQYKKDVTASRLFFDWDNNLRVEGVPYQLTSFSLSQILSRFTPSGVGYIKKMLKGSEKDQKLAQECINNGIQKAIARRKGSVDPFLVRTRQLPNGQKFVRAVLSDKYQVLDNHEILSGVVNNLSGSMIPARLRTSDSGFELVVIDRLLSRDVAPNDRNYIATVYRNSEVGNGSFSCILGIFRAICLNGLSMPVSAYGLKPAHSGRRDIRAAIDTHIGDSFLKAGDILNALEASKQQTIDRVLVEPTIELIAKDGRWAAPFEDAVKVNSQKEESSQYGIIQAITHSAKGLNHDLLNQTETFAGKLLTSNFDKYVRQAAAISTLG